MITIQPHYQGVELELFSVFTSAISEVCSNDYTPEKIRAWLPLEYNPEKWRSLVEGINPYIAKFDGNIAGYADIQNDGYMDHFFVGAGYQSKGVGSALMAVIL